MNKCELDIYSLSLKYNFLLKLKIELCLKSNFPSNISLENSYKNINHLQVKNTIIFYYFFVIAFLRQIMILYKILNFSIQNAHNFPSLILCLIYTIKKVTIINIYFCILEYDVIIL